MFSFNEYLFFVLAYLIGSIPFGVIIARMYGLGDITKLGSGNIGATNLTRVGGKKLGSITFLLDFMKSALPTFAFKSLFPGNDGYLICALLAVIGHILPVFNNFKGGKGVASSFGALLAVSPLIFLLTAATWVATFLITRISSASAILAFSLMPVFTATITSNFRVMIFAIILSLIIFICHLSNIKRLLNGEEKKFK